MAQKDGEASVEDILRSIKQVISREDGPRRSPDSFARDAARENGEPMPERPASFSPYAFQRHSPFGARPPEGPAPDRTADEDNFEDSRTDVFDLRSLDSDAFGDDDDTAGHEGDAHDDEPIVLAPPNPETGTPQWSVAEQDDDAGDEPASVEEPASQSHDDVEDEPSYYGEVPSTHTDQIDTAEVEEAFEPEAEPTPAGHHMAEQDRDTGASEGLIAGAAAEALRERFSALEQAAHGGNDTASGKAAPNPLEDMVRDMLRPMLKQWLDDNMPGLVEKIVEREIARITGRL